MNTILELQAAVNELIAPMLAKGLVQREGLGDLRQQRARGLPRLHPHAEVLNG